MSAASSAAASSTAKMVRLTMLTANVWPFVFYALFAHLLDDVLYVWWWRGAWADDAAQVPEVTGAVDVLLLALLLEFELYWRGMPVVAVASQQRLSSLHRTLLCVLKAGLFFVLLDQVGVLGTLVLLPVALYVYSSKIARVDYRDGADEAAAPPVVLSVAVVLAVAATALHGSRAAVPAALHPCHGADVFLAYTPRATSVADWATGVALAKAARAQERRAHLFHPVHGTVRDFDGALLPFQRTSLLGRLGVPSHLFTTDTVDAAVNAAERDAAILVFTPDPRALSSVVLPKKKRRKHVVLAAFSGRRDLDALCERLEASRTDAEARDRATPWHEKGIIDDTITATEEEG